MNIAISGKMGAGKDTLAKYIIDNYTYDDKPFKRLAFADDIKLMVKEMFSVEKDKHPNAREILQLYGHIGRLARPLYWVEPILEEVNEDDRFNYIVTDLRFTNEADKLAQEGFILIRINADRDIRNKRRKLINEDDISETDLDDYVFDFHFDCDCHNNSIEYRHRVRALMHTIAKINSLNKLKEIK